MTTLIFTIMLLSGIIFILSVLLMTPKWGLWFGVWGMSTSNEYGSKKSVESTLKKSAVFSIIVFALTVVIYPYIAKDQLSSTNSQQQIELNDQQIEQLQQQAQDSVDIESEDIEINSSNTESNVINNEDNTNWTIEE